MTSITGQLADFCAGLRPRLVPDLVFDHAAAVLLDWLGAAFAGASSESGALTRQLEPLLGGPREASLVGCAQRASICLAALHNGTSSSVHELDDVHRDAAIHPGVVVIPAALAVAEGTRCGARELLGSIVAGYEVMARVGWMLGPSHYHQWHTTSTSGCFGAAAAAGFAWGLDPGMLGAALGLAGAQAGGVWEGISREAVMVKHFHGGRAAAAGSTGCLPGSNWLSGCCSRARRRTGPGRGSVEEHGRRHPDRDGLPRHRLHGAAELLQTVSVRSRQLPGSRCGRLAGQPLTTLWRMRWKR